MEASTNVLMIIFPIAVTAFWLLAAYYIIKTIIYVMRLPKQLNAMEKRIRELENKEDL